MVVEYVIGAVLIAFGILSIYFSIEQRGSVLKDTHLMIVLIVGVLSIFGGGWIYVSKLTLGFVLKKLFALFLAGIGVFLVIGFPDILDYQKEGMSKAGIFIGIVLSILGIWLLLT
ncbi:MAG: hypothetical protein HY364_03795 [Candidatus Aenigmarchaeota archaeon]|nr:hypothetical protein [Candidatus Aenigmarchaeota archaeon]